jgi:hypothetical protein
MLYLKKIINLFPKKEIHQTILLLGIILIIGASFRLYHLGSNPLIADEFLDMNASYGYFKTNVWQAWDFNQNSVNTLDVFAPRDERAWMYKWQVAQMFKFFPATEAVGRLVSVIWGLLTIVLMYFITKSFTKNRTVAIIAALLFAISVSGIEFDRRLRMYAMFYPVYLLLSWLFFQFLESKYQGSVKWFKKISDRIGIQPLYLIPLAAVGALSFHLQLLTANIAPTVAVYIFIMAIAALYKKTGIWNKYIVFSLLGIIGFIGAKIFLPGIVGLFLGSLKFFIDNSEYLVKIFHDYSQVLLAVIVGTFGLYWLSERLGKPKEALWLFVSLAVPLLMAAFMWKRPQGLQYVFFIQSFLIILMATGIYGIAQFFKQHFGSLGNRAYTAALILLFLLLPNYGYFFEGGDNTYHRDNSSVGDYRKVFAYVQKKAKSGELIVTRNFRTYYLKNGGFNVYDFGGERAISDLSLDTISTLVTQNKSGWIVLFDNDSQFLSNQALDYMKKNLEQVDVSAIRGAAKAYRWGVVQ